MAGWGMYEYIALLAAVLGFTFALWNLRAHFRLRKVVYRPRPQRAVRHGDSRQVETALMRRTLVQFIAWIVGTIAFVALVMPLMAHLIALAWP